MKALVTFILAILSTANCSFSQDMKIVNKVYYGQMTQELKNALKRDVQRQQSDNEVAFVVVVNFDGTVRVLEPSEDQGEKATYPRKASLIKNVYAATITSFEGSHECIDYIDTNGYKKRRCKRHE